MSNPLSPTAELVQLLLGADEEAIRKRLDELRAEEAALRTLLRSVAARNRSRQCSQREPSHAAAS